MAKLEIIIQLDYTTIQQTSTTYQVGSTIANILEYPDIAVLLAPIKETNYSIAIYGQQVTLDHIPAPDDRIEICLPLRCDPKAMRKNKAKINAKK